MRTQTKTLAALAIALGVLAIFSRTKRGALVVATVTDSIANLARGLRNNNPGNVQLTVPATQWIGWVGADQQSDPVYVQMQSMAAGVRMALTVFRNYQKNYGLKNIAELIARWAPPSENDTETYVANVAARVGIAPGFTIDLRNRDTAYDFLRAVFRQENGVAAELIPASTLYDGIEAAA